MLQFKDDDDIHKAVVCVQEGSTAAMPLRNNNDNTRSTSTPVIAASVRGFAVPSTADELHHAKSRWSEESWQFKALRFINSHPVQTFMICLLCLDVLILFIELLLETYFPLCAKVIPNAVSCCPAIGDQISAEVEIRRILEEEEVEGTHSSEHHSLCISPLVETSYAAGCDPHAHHGIHVTEEILFWMTVVILGLFEVELLTLIYLLGPVKFFKQFLYVLDLVIVSASLALELSLQYIGDDNTVAAVLPELLIVFRVWRFVRIGHGLVASAHEVGLDKMHTALEHIEQLEGMLKNSGIAIPERPKKLHHQEE